MNRIILIKVKEIIHTVMFARIRACTCVYKNEHTQTHTHIKWCLIFYYYVYIFQLLYEILFELICFITVADAVVRFKLFFLLFFFWCFISYILLITLYFDQMYTEFLHHTWLRLLDIISVFAYVAFRLFFFGMCIVGNFRIE